MFLMSALVQSSMLQEDRDLIRRLAVEPIVLFENDNNILLLDKAKTVAVLGPNAQFAAYPGGSSACLRLRYTVTPFEGTREQCDKVRFCQRAYGHKDPPLLGAHLRTPDGRQGFYLRGYDKPPNSPELELLDSLHLTDSYVFIMDYEVPD
ncbi:MAG: hypothetical protein Q9164_003544 [Protoblastenia rupestris]